MAFIDANRAELGVDPVCALCCRWRRVRTTRPGVPPRSAGATRDAGLVPRLRDLGHENDRVYGARKLWKCAGRAGIDIGRDQVARLMRAADIVTRWGLLQILTS